MANIDIKDLATLNLDGNDLFTDSESFIVELSDNSDRDLILGGCQWGISYPITGGTDKTTITDTILQ